MAITVILEGAGADRCAVRLSPLAELCACLHALHDSEHHPGSWEFTADIRTRPDARLLADAEEWSPLWGALRSRFLYPLDIEGDRGLDAEIAAIGRLPLRAFVAMCVEPIVDRDGSIPYHRVLDDEEVGRAFLEHARRFSPERLALAERLLRDPRGCRADLQGFLRTFAEAAFEAEWQRVLPALRDDAAQRRRDLDRHGLSAIAHITGTAQEHRTPHRVVFDKLYQAMARVGDDPCVLVPSAHVGPHVVIKHQRGLPITVQYAAAPVGGTETPLADVDRRLRALSDPSRLMLCRALLRGRRTTVDLANYTGMSEPQVSRHLRRLREAGLVVTSRDGRLVFYQLDTEVLRRVGTDLLGALWR